MNTFNSVDQHDKSSQEVQNDTNKKKNQQKKAENDNNNNNSRNSFLNNISPRCFVIFLMVALSIIIICTIFMAIMTTHFYSNKNTNDLNYNKIIGPSELEDIFNDFKLKNNSDIFESDSNKERNVLGWLKNTIKKSFFDKKGSKDNLDRPIDGSSLTSKETDTQDCGNPSIQPRLFKTRIMNGKEAIPNSWPWAVSIGLEGPRDYIPHACGGTLINKRIVVTAAHCVIKNSIYSLVGAPLKNVEKFSSIEKMLRIYIGVHDRFGDIKSNNIYGVESIKMHENFDPITFKNDIAILKLNRDVEKSNHIGFACLNSVNQVSAGDNVYAIGWGYTEKSNTQASRYLMQVDLTVQRKENCLIQFLNIDQFCAGNVYQKKDTCNGDSGGPLLKLVNNKWTFVGIVSNGDVRCAGTGIYINVAYFYDWIKFYSRLN